MGVALKCLGCGTPLRNGEMGSRLLCEECKRFAKLARYGTRCPECRSEDVVYTTERTGRETLFCSNCDYIWTRVPSLGENQPAVIVCRRLWVGRERRLDTRSARASKQLDPEFRHRAS